MRHRGDHIPHHGRALTNLRRPSASRQTSLSGERPGFRTERRNIAFGKDQHPLVLDVDCDSLGITRTFRILKVETPGIVDFRYARFRLFDDIKTHVFALAIVVTDVGDQQIADAVEGERGDILPVPVGRIRELDSSQVSSCAIDCVQLRRAVVVDDPEYVGIPLRPGETACLINLVILQGANDR